MFSSGIKILEESNKARENLRPAQPTKTNRTNPVESRNLTYWSPFVQLDQRFGQVWWTTKTARYWAQEDEKLLRKMIENNPDLDPAYPPT